MKYWGRGGVRRVESFSTVLFIKFNNLQHPCCTRLNRFNRFIQQRSTVQQKFNKFQQHATIDATVIANRRNMIFGRAPSVNRAISVCCYLVGIAITLINIIYTQKYFDNFLSTQADLQFWTVWAISAAIGLYEAFCIGICTTPPAWGIIFSIPKSLASIQNESQKKIATGASIALVIFLAIFCCVVYYVDFVTTIGGLGMSDVMAARFLASCLVFGSEVMYLAGNSLAWLALIGKAGIAQDKKKYEDLIKSAENNGSSKYVPK